MKPISSDPSLTAPEIVQVQLLSPDGTSSPIPFTRAEFDRLAKEAAAESTEVGEYIQKKILRTLAADRTKDLRDRAAFLRGHEGGVAQTRLSMREALDAIALGLGDVDDIETVMARGDEAAALAAFALVFQVGCSARTAKVFEQELKILRDRFLAAEAEIAQKTAALRTLNREATPERMEARITEARAAERAAVAADLLRLNTEVAQQRSEIVDLRASKKKLREALDRAKEGR